MIVLDIEATGRFPETCGIVSIGAICEDDLDEFYLELSVDDSIEIEDEALNINGFSRDQIFDKSKPGQVEGITLFHDWLKKKDKQVLAGLQMGNFDYMFFDIGARKYSLGFRFPFRIIDMHTLAYTSMLKTGHEIEFIDSMSRLTAKKIYEYCNMPNEPRPHNALTGAKWELEALSRLMYGKSKLDNFSKHEVPKYLCS